MFDLMGQDGERGDMTQRTLERVRAIALGEGDGASFSDLDRCVSDVVSSLSDGRVSGFVPLLAIRQVRCCIRAGSCDCGVC